ncbi:MAG: major royal jelly family protein [Bacteroidia bacterium]|nr:major royal jelly family protein [Bacteroidia bacterium]
MKTIKRIFSSIGIILVLIIFAFVIFMRLRYGGGKAYQDISTAPIYSQNELIEVLAFDEPIGNVAASKDTNQITRVFFTIHPESRPDKNKLMEIVNGKAIPYPDASYQDNFKAVLGVFTDLQNRLWTIDHGNHGFDEVKLTAFDLNSNKVSQEFTFPTDVAKKFSFFNDLTVSPDGKYIAVANVSFFGKQPSLAVLKLESGESKNLLEGHSSMRDEGFVPVTPHKKMRFFGGMVDLLTGIDGLDFSRDGRYMYYAPMGSSNLYRIPTEVAFDFSKTDAQLAEAVESVARKPLSDGIRTDHQGNVYITDVENQGIYIVTPEAKGFTLIKDERIRWADGLSLSGTNTFYLADSDIPNQMLQSKKHIKENAPYHIYRFKAWSENK